MTNNQADLKGVFQALTLRWVKQKTKTAKETNKSMPEGIKARVLMSREIKVTDNITFRQLRKIQAVLGVKVKSQTPIKTKIPLPKPMKREILLPFLCPMKPPIIRKRP
jgi:hypothetical protein